MQTVAGLVLDSKSQSNSTPTLTNAAAVQSVLDSLLCLNLIQMASLFWLRWKDTYSQVSPGYQPIAIPYEDDDEQRSASGDDAHVSLLLSPVLSPRSSDSGSQFAEDRSNNTPSEGERRRGRVFVVMSGMTIFSTWTLFIISAWIEFSKHSRE